MKDQIISHKTHRHSKHGKLADTKQNALHLSAIQLGLMMGLPMLSVNIWMLNKYGFVSALYTLLVGNIVLWGIKYGIILICKGTRKNTLDITRDYVGYYGSFFVAAIMLASTLAWFVEQTSVACSALIVLIPINEGPQISPYIQWSVYLGGISTLLCMQGIVLLRWIAVITFPLMLGSIVVLVFLAPTNCFIVPNIGFSLAGLPMVIGTSLGMSADLPTFFRHSASWKESKKALIIIQSISLTIGVLSLFLASIISSDFGSLKVGVIDQTSSLVHVVFTGLIIMSAITANIANVYSASVAWELTVPMLAGKKEYLILGLGLTSIFIFITQVYSMVPLLIITDNGLINLSLIFLAGYMISLVKKNEMDIFDKTVLFLAWFFSTVLNISSYIRGEEGFIISNSLLDSCITIGAIILVFYGSRRIQKLLFR